ncbi:hypothetical protein BKA62DRAFT_37305 [Auriculariales sp. MPI-PUGE-AT-0066]|nr:hypothetical protein BKA62DRAFT_37305 [Auriculariales sp. MPI-PUGE-AT-0066]
MFDSLPVELAVHIVQICAYRFRHTHRSTVVSLARTSSYIYTLVAPIIYESIILTTTNVHAFSVTPQNDQTLERVCKHVLNLCVSGDVKIDSLNVRMFSRVRAMQSTTDALRSIALAQGEKCALEDVQIAHIDFVTGTRTVPSPALCNITRIFGFYPNMQSDFYSDFLDDPSRWARRLLDLLPKLTHIGFNMLHSSYRRDNQDVSAFDVDLYERLLRTTQQYNRLRMIAFRLAGMFLSRAEDLMAVVGRVGDSRVRFWCDSRVVKTWEDDEHLCTDDVRHERSIWTEARLT